MCGSVLRFEIWDVGVFILGNSPDPVLGFSGRGARLLRGKIRRYLIACVEE